MTNSVFLNLARTGNNKWWRTVLVILSIILGQVIGSFAFEIYYIKTNPGLSIAEILNFSKRGDYNTFSEILVVFLTCLALFWFAFRFLHKRKPKTTIFAGSKFNWRLYLQGFFAYAIIIAIVIIFTNQKELSQFITNFNLQKFVPLAIFGFIAFGVQSFTEEVLFRGYLFQMLSLTKLNTTFAIAIESIIFGLLHLPSGISNFINAVLIGVVLSLITLWHNRIEFAAGAHNANNLMIALIIGNIGKTLTDPYDSALKSIDVVTGILSMIAIGYIAYRLGNKGNLTQTID